MNVIIVTVISCFLIFPAVIVSAAECPRDGKKVVCYLASWSHYRPGNGSYTFDELAKNPFLCTHLTYTFAGLDIDGHLMSLDPDNDITRYRGYYRVLELKEKNPCLKVLIAVGGWNEGSEKYSLAAETEKSREEFAEYALKFLVYYGFDGLDIVSFEGGLPVDRHNFVELLKVLKKKFVPRNKILTTAVGMTTTLIRESYDFSQICDICDMVLLMAYDFHEINRTSVNAPLFREETQNPYTESIAENIELIQKQGCKVDKLILGIPTYGRTYTLKDKNDDSIDAPIEKMGKMGPYTLSDGSLGFHEICEKLLEGGWKIKYLTKNAAKVAVKGKEWMSYDDPETVYQKSLYAQKKGMGGIMFWTIDTDDFRARCYKQKYPLIATGRYVLFGDKLDLV